MKVKANSLFVVALTCAALVNSSLVELGEADGKLFYAEVGTSLEWYSSMIYCQDNGMRLASITSVNQTQVVAAGLNRFFKVFWWTAARETRGVEMFTWEGSDSNPDEAVFESWDDSPVRGDPYHYCGAFWPVNSTTGLMATLHCSEYLVGTVCEMDANYKM